jgi:hypothetical protein
MYTPTHLRHVEYFRWPRSGVGYTVISSAKSRPAPDDADQIGMHDRWVGGARLPESPRPP